MNAERRIELPSGHVALVDPGDYDRVAAAGPWRADKGRWTTYAMRNIVAPAGHRTTEPMHRFITGWALTDHINGDGLDNRRENLREATPQQNNYNRGPSCTNRSGYKGVAWHKASKKWRARIGAYGKDLIIGYFDDPVEAARAYDLAAIVVAGPFARLNLPVTEERPTLDDGLATWIAEQLGVRG